MDGCDERWDLLEVCVAGRAQAFNGHCAGIEQALSHRESEQEIDFKCFPRNDSPRKQGDG